MEYLVTGSFDGTLAVWDVRCTPGPDGLQPSLLKRWPAHPPTEQVTASLSLQNGSPDDTSRAVGQPHNSGAHDTADSTGSACFALDEQHAGAAAAPHRARSPVPDTALRCEVRCVHFVPACRLLCCGGNDTCVRVRTQALAVRLVLLCLLADSCVCAGATACASLESTVC